MGGVVRSHRPAPSLDELDEPIRSIERELHRTTLSNICSYLNPDRQEGLGTTPVLASTPRGRLPAAPPKPPLTWPD